MNIKIGKSSLDGKIHIISSKSDVHRILIAAALADEETEVCFRGWSEDIEATADCLAACGAKIEKLPDGARVSPISRGGQSVVLDCGESGSTLRFLLPVVAALGFQAEVVGRGRLPQRPIDVLLDEMRKNGSVVTENYLPVVLSGQLRGGVYTLPGNISSQFITGLLFALPLLAQDSEIRLTTRVESKGYIDMTLDTLGKFGIRIEEKENGYFIRGAQKYRSPRHIEAEGDWSSAAFWLAAGAVGNRITCAGLQACSLQKDREIITLMERFGAKIERRDNEITVSGGELSGIEIDASQVPDLVPILCVVAAMAKGVTRIYNAERLRIKESDRLQAMADGLKRIGVQAEERADGILIYGGLQGKEDMPVIDVYGDHRIVMSFAIGGTTIEGGLMLEGAEAVSKSYPSFFAEFVGLGGVADVV